MTITVVKAYRVGNSQYETLEEAQYQEIFKSMEALLDAQGFEDSAAIVEYLLDRKGLDELADLSTRILAEPANEQQ